MVRHARENANPRSPGAVEKPLVGSMAFTPLTRGARGVAFPAEGGRAGRVKYYPLRLPPILPCHEPPNPPCQGGAALFNNPSPLGFDPAFAVIGQTRGRARFSREFVNRIPPEFLKISINSRGFSIKK